MAGKPKLPRAAQLERAAKLRAILIAFINRQDFEVSVHDIEVSLHDQLKELGGDDVVAAIPFQLKMLAANGLIHAGKDGGKCVYSKRDKPSKTPVEPTKPVVDDVVPVNIQVDFVKSTGRVRFLLNGIVIEIGVV